MIRKGRVIAALAVLALIFVFSKFFLDGLVKRGIETAGTKANGARVDLDSANVSFLHLSVTLNRLQVTDQNNPMTNAFDVARMRFKLESKPLFWKKFVIEDAAIDGIRTGTARKSSGAVKAADKPAEPAEAGPGAGERAKEAGSFAMANLKEQYDPKKLITLDNLASYKKIKEQQDRLPGLEKEWNDKLDAVKTDDKVKDAQAFVDRVKGESFSGAEGLKKAKDVLKDGKRLKGDLEGLQKQVSDLRGGVMAQVAETKNSLKEIDRLKQQDMDGALSGLKGSFSAEGITRGLIGPEWFGKVQTGLGWFHKVRKLVPQKKAVEKPAAAPKRKGEDIHFPFKYNWPTFWLKTAALTGSTAGGLEYGGTLKDVTSDPKTLGKPITLELNGQAAGGVEMTLRGVADYTADVARESVKLNYSGLKLAGTKLGNVGAPVSIKDGAGTVSANLEAKGEQIAGKIDFNAAPVKLSHELSPEQANNRLLGLVHQTLAQLNQLSVGVTVSDTITSPNFKLTTNVDNALEGAVKQVLAKELEEIKAAARARVNELVDGEKQKLAADIEKRTGLASDKFASKDKAVSAIKDQVEKSLQDLEKKAAGSLPVPANLPIKLPGASQPAPASEGQPAPQQSAPALPKIKNPFKK